MGCLFFLPQPLTMNKITIFLLTSLFNFSALGQTTKPIVIKSGLDSASYAFGLMLSTQLKNDGLDGLNYELAMSGLKDGFSKQPALLNQEQSQQAISRLFERISETRNASSIAAGKKFLEANGKKAGVMTTKSGLQYQVINAGSGIKPNASSKVLVHYRGTLLDGTQFDSSYDRGKPVPLGVDNVIQGWTEGLQLMQKGAKYKFFVPYDLGYGSRAAGPQIPAYSTLIFEIELLEVDGK